jgi:hypothetical protein
MLTEEIKKQKESKFYSIKGKVSELKINSKMNSDEISDLVSSKLLVSLEKTFANNVYKK